MTYLFSENTLLLLAMKWNKTAKKCDISYLLSLNLFMPKQPFIF